MRCRAQVPRMLLAAAGVEYTDVRAVDANHKSTGNPGEVPAESVADTMDWNLGRMPICEADGVAIGQGGSIARFLASTYGLNGASLVERGQIDSICEALGELKSAFRGAEDKALFFDDETAGDYSGVAVRETRPQRAAKWYAGRLEGLVGDGGIAVGSSLSLADVMIYNALKENSPPEESPDMGDARRYPFGGMKDKADELLAAHPKLSAICDAVAANPGIAKHLATRGAQGF